MTDAPQGWFEVPIEWPNELEIARELCLEHGIKDAWFGHRTVTTTLTGHGKTWSRTSPAVQATAAFLREEDSVEFAAKFEGMMPKHAYQEYAIGSAVTPAERATYAKQLGLSMKVTR